MKACPDCKERKSADEFSKNRSSSDGLNTYCKSCAKVRIKRSRDKNPDAYKTADALYRKSNPEKVRVTNRLSKIRRRKVTACQARIRYQKPQERLAKSIRNQLNSLLRTTALDKNVLGLGCTVRDFRDHIEGQFQDGMSWENYGMLGWTFDHIKPLLSYDLTVAEEYLKASHYTNVQPLWYGDNIRKGAKQQP